MSKFVTLHGFGGGSSDTELNFEVVGGTTQPSNPTENMIWVNTDVEITGWYFSSIEPENMNDGEVWFDTNITSNTEFNALKKNNLMIYPSSAKQLVSSTFKIVVAKTYQDGEWVDWTTYLYNVGNEFNNLTGGWIGIEHTSNNDGTLTITRNATSMNIKWYGYWCRSSVYTKNKIKVDNGSTLICKFSSTTRTSYVVDGYYIKFGLFSDISASGATEVAVVDILGKTGEATIDISYLSGEYYIGFYMCVSKTNAEGLMSVDINELTEVSIL